MGQAVTVKFRDGQKELPVLPFGLAKRSLRGHVDGFVFCFALVLRRTYLNAESTTCAVFWRNLQGVSQILKFAPARFLALERLWSIRKQRGVINFCANHRMRADQYALAALDAQLFVPNGDFLCDVSLFPSRGAGRKSAVRRKGADGQIIAATRYNFAKHVANKVG